MSSVVTKNKTRLDFRLAVETKQLIEQAASILGQTVSDFAVSNLVKSAQDVITQHQQTKLSTNDFKLFLQMLENDEEPNGALKKAAENHKNRVISK